MDWKSHKVLIIGGAGFIGTSLASYLLSEGADVTIFDNFTQKSAKKNIKWLRTKFANFRVMHADVMDLYRVKQAVKNKTIIFYEAVFRIQSENQAFLDYEFSINTKGCLNLLEAVRTLNREAIVVYASTSKVYKALEEKDFEESETRYVVNNNQILGGFNEDHSRDYNDNFLCARASAENFFIDYYLSHNIKTILLRQSSIFGPLQAHNYDSGWLSKFLELAKSGEPINIYGNGKQVRDVLYIDDLINAYELAIENISVTEGEVFNVGGGLGNSISILEAVKIIENILNKKLDIQFYDWLPNDQKVSISNTQKAFNSFGWSPKTSVKQGIQQMLDFQFV